MKAVIQNFGTGELSVAEIHPPALVPGGILVHNRTSLVSAGTEGQTVGLARKSLAGKALARPDLVKMVADKARRDGIVNAVETARRRLDKPVPLGYSCAGVVAAVGEGVRSFRPGDRVACAGAGYASHADVIVVPENLAVTLPPAVDFESAAFTTLGAIALQGIRLAEVQYGETVAIVGLGLLGLLSVQLARAAGCTVIGMDPDAERCRLAATLGADEAFSEAAQASEACMRASGGAGADRVVITAASRDSSPLKLAGEAARDRATVVAVGLTGLEIPRKDYFEKELTFRVSRSYGPGRYDTEYEEKGHDYPIGYVRWTENRNMRAFVVALARKEVDVGPLVTHRLPVDEALKAYELITGEKKEPYLGIVLTYEEEKEGEPGPSASTSADPSVAGRVGIGFLGAGSFATGTLIPALKKVADLSLESVCTASGVSAANVGRKFGFRSSTTSEDSLLADPAVTAVVIATRHRLHGGQTVRALKAGKHVFVEKPLCLTRSELTEITGAWDQAGGESTRPVLTVGFNRRFAPMAGEMKEFLDAAAGPLMMTYRVNAGAVPLSHWVHDPEVGGGRIVGEACHFIDFLTFLSGARPRRVSAKGLPNDGLWRDDNVAITVEFSDGSVGSVVYAACGDRSMAKERVEAFRGGRSAVLDNFRRLVLHGGGRKKMKVSRLGQDKGFDAELARFADAVRGGTGLPIPVEEIFSVTLATLAARESLFSGEQVEVPSLPSST